MTHTVNQNFPQLRPGLPRPAQTSLGQVAAWGLPLAAALAVVAHFVPIAAGAAFAFIFVSVAFWQPRIALMIIFALVPIQQPLPLHLPVKLSISEFGLAFFLPIVLLKTAQMGKAIRLGPTLWPTVIYLALCLFSTLLYPHWHLLAIKAYAQMLVYIVIAPMICASFPGDTDDLRFAIEGAVGMAAILALFALLTHFHYPHENKNAWGENFGGAFAMAMELWLAAKIAKRRTAARWLSAALLLIGMGLFMCLSRGGWLEGGVACIFILALRRRFTLMFRAAIILLPLLVILFLFLPHKKQHYAFNFNPNAGNLKPRVQLIHYAYQEFEDHPVAGVGVGLRKKVDPTDLFLITLAETGLQGLAAFLAIYFVIIRTAWDNHKRLLQVDPRFTLVALGGALVLGRFVHGMVDEYWTRGSIVWAWCAVGMLSAVKFELDRQAKNRAAITPPPPRPQTRPAPGQQPGR